jgi:hypothetical protein
MNHRDHLQSLIKEFSANKLTALLRLLAPTYRPAAAPLDGFIKADWPFDQAHQLGIIELAGAQTVLTAAIHVRRELTSRSGKQIQYELGKAILKSGNHNAGLFAFYDDAGRFRLSLITVAYSGTRRQFSAFRRYTFFVDPDSEGYRTFVEQIGQADFSTLENITAAFSVEPVTRAFFREYGRLFQKAEDSLPADWPPEQKRLYTQRFFNRLVFIAFLERKGWLTFNGRADYLRALFENYWQSPREPQANFHRSRLNVLFFWGLNNAREQDERDLPNFATLRTLIGDVPFLNGGLFEKEADDETFFFPDALVAEILSDLLYRFNFTVAESTPLDVEVAVDPEMLGKMFEEVVTGRHESGSYYTPKEVVSFMGREVLLRYLSETIPQEATQSIETFVLNGDATALSHPESVLAALRQVKICDPACGSGAYLVGMLHELLELRAALFTARVHDADTVYERKLEIIQNNLYGVDKDPFAVNIARLRLWLSLIVDYEGNTPPPLPNLDFKIEAGDALLAPNPSQFADLSTGFRSQLLQDFATLKARYLTAHGREKLDLRKQISAVSKEIRNWLGHSPADDAFDWAVEFAEIFSPALSSGNVLQSASGGFDILLANPPYVRQELLGEYKARLRPMYPEVYNGTADLYVYFYARAQQLLKPGGMACFISSNKWLRAAYGENLRQHLLDSQAFHFALDFGELPVFQSAATFPAVFLWQKAPRGDRPTLWAVVKDLRDAYEEGLSTYLRRAGEALPAEQFGAGKPRLVSRPAADLRRQMERRGIPLGEYVNGQIYYGIKTGYNEAFLINRTTRDRLIAADPRSTEIIQPLLKGDDVRRYEIHFREHYLIWTYIGVPIERYPAVFAHLQRHRAKLEARADQGEHWWELRACDYYDAFRQPKILIPAFAMTSRFAMDYNHFLTAPLYFISTENWYLLAVLNSQPAFALLKKLCTVLGDEEQKGRVVLRPVYFQKLPIPDASVNERTALAHIAEQTQALHARRRKLVEGFLHAIGLPPARSNSRNPLEKPWLLSEEEFTRRSATKFISHYRTTRDETAALTEQIETLEAEINARVAALYGL